MRALFCVVLCLGMAVPAAGQEFGQNKVQRKDFKFLVLTTEHFDIYYYAAEEKAAREVGRMAERWYTRLRAIFAYELSNRQVVVLYASHPDFEQTNVVEGAVSEGVGGVTEGGRRRVVLPMAATLGDTEHVLGHELVHAFQYDLLGRTAAGSMPLWMIEGMAEYLSIGPRDAPTAVWLRDAAYTDRLPALKDLDDPRFFPYRFGHAFWAYVAGRFGDQIVAQILLQAGDVAATTNPIKAVESATGVDQATLSDQWHASIRQAFDIAKGATRSDRELGGGVTVGPRKERGRMDVGPSLSPDGQRIAFLSERSRISIDLYLADANTGEVLKKLVSTASNPHYDSLEFLASAGSWSPDGKQLVVATIQSGSPVLVVFDGSSGNRVKEIPLPTFDDVLQPAWSPDGRRVAFAGQVGGFTDIYLYSFDTNQTQALTNDAFGDLQPAWSPDGQRIAFVTERFSTNLTTLAIGDFGLATMTLADSRVNEVPTGLTGNLTNPQWSADGKIYFIADAAGRPNVYRVDPVAGGAVRLTAAATGVGGITVGSAALSVAARSDRLATTLFKDSGYEIHVLEKPSGLAAMAELGSDGAILPPLTKTGEIVSKQLAQASTGLPVSSAFTTKGYKPRFGLVSIGQQAGVTTSQFGTFFGGGISLGFSDILGEHLLGVGAGINGGVRDVSAFGQYVNRVHRWNWGLFGERAPLVSASAATGFAVVDGETVFVQQVELFRQTITQTGALIAYPFSRSTRVEFSGDVQHISFDRELQTQTFDPITGVQLTDDKVRIPLADSLRLADATAAFIHDTSVFGATAPILGQRARVDVSQTYGDLRFTTVSADYRRYAMPFQPVSFAGRILHIGRYGASGEDTRLVPLFLGYPNLVRGWDSSSFSASECSATVDGSCPEFDRLIGSRVLVANGEVRVPAVGLFMGKLQYGPLPVDLVAFVDAGVAWTSSTLPTFAGGDRKWATSVGFGARFNLFGIVGEFDLAHPLSRPGKGMVFVFALKSGF